MFTIYDIPDKVALANKGWKTKKYENCSKKELLEYIECLEHNWADEIKGSKLLQERLSRFYGYCKEINHPELFSEITSLPGEWGYKRNDFPTAKLFDLMIDRNDYWYYSWVKAQRDIKILKSIIEDIKSYNLYTYDVDYDYEEEPIDSYSPFDINYIIKNAIETFKIEEDEFNEGLLKSNDLKLVYDDDKLDEDFYKAQENVIKSLAVDKKDNFYDYYEEDNNGEKKE